MIIIKENYKPIDENLIKDMLRKKGKEHNIYKFETIDSTNQEAKRKIKNNLISKDTIIVSEHQTNGKGRNQNIWKDINHNNILLSLVLKVDQQIYNPIITLLTGYSICKYIRKLTNKNFMLKWPNDIIIDNKKICGILIESIIKNINNNFIIIGVGFNVNQDTFPNDISSKATSLFKETNIKYNRNEIISDLIYCIEEELYNYKEDNQNEFISKYQSLCATIGKEILIDRNNKVYSGTAICINKNGELVALLEDKNLVNINFGEIAVQGIY